MLNIKWYDNCTNLILLSDLKSKYLRTTSQNQVFLKEIFVFSTEFLAVVGIYIYIIEYFYKICF